MSRSVLVTGGNRGIGLATARALSAQGHRVAVTYRTDPPEGLLAVRCDVTSSDDVDRAFGEVEEQQGAVEVLVSNAGITDDGLLLRMSEQSFTSVVDTNLTAAYRAAKRASRPMLKARWGRLVFVSSVVGLARRCRAGQQRGLEVRAGRAVTVDRTRAGRTRHHQQRGGARLRRHRHDRRARRGPHDRAAGAGAPGPYGPPDEVAGVIAFLAGDASSYVTGAVLPVDGGLGMGH